jgi:hypothetical protein
MSLSRINAFGTIGATLAVATAAVLGYAWQQESQQREIVDCLTSHYEGAGKLLKCSRTLAGFNERTVTVAMCREMGREMGMLVPWDDCDRIADKQIADRATESARIAAEPKPEPERVESLTESPAEYKARVGHDFGPRAEDHGTPLCSGRMTRDGCQR